MDQQIGYLLKVITDKLKVRADADFKSYGMTIVQSRILGYLHEWGGEATQKEIENFLQVAHPTAYDIVSRMERNGFLITWLDSGDKRNKIVKMTEKAVSIGEEIKIIMKENDKRLLRSLTEEQITEFKNTLMVIYKNPDWDK